MQEFGPLVPQREAAVLDKEAGRVEFTELDSAVLIGDQEWIAGLGAIGREHEFHATEFQNAGLWVFGLTYGLFLRSQSIEIDVVDATCLKVVGALDGVDA